MILAATPSRSQARAGTLIAVGSMTCVQLGLALAVPLFGQVPRPWSLAGVALVVAAGLGAERTGARPDGMSKADASRLIDELQEVSGRGRDG